MDILVEEGKTPEGPPRFAAQDRLPVVIRPRRMTLNAWEELAREHPGFGKRIAVQPRHLEALARAILRHDVIARERFGDEDTLVRYLSARLQR